MKSLFLVLSLLVLAACGNSSIMNQDMEKGLFPGKSNPILANGHIFKKANYAFSISWTSGPALGNSIFELKFWDKKLGTENGPYTLPYELETLIWMPGMGHGSTPVRIVKIADGEYEVHEVNFTMRGKWDLHVILKQDGKEVDKVLLPYKL